jgi:DNA-binding transcriptional regulator YiaG
MTGDEFKKLRIKLGYKTRPMIASEIGVSWETVKKWETGKTTLPEYAAKALGRIKQQCKPFR